MIVSDWRMDRFWAAINDGQTMTQNNVLTPPTIRRIRHELKQREPQIIDVYRLTPHMIRVELQGDDLSDFISASPDDHIKIFVTDKNGDEVRRDYTPRRFDAETKTLTLDFVDHDGGPAADWARDVKIGETLRIGGPRGSGVIEGDIAHWILIGDETALPSIGRRIEELGANDTVTAIIAVPDGEDEQTFETPARLTTRWVHRDLAQAGDATPFVEALECLDFEAATFFWVACEAMAARAIRKYLLEQRGIDAKWIKAAGYWTIGKADASDKSLD